MSLAESPTTQIGTPGHATEHKLLIDGELVAGDERLDVIDPATGRVGTTVARASEEQLERAVAAARRAYPAWAATSIEERRQLVREWADAMEAHAEALTEALVREQGKPEAEAVGEVDWAPLFIRGYTEIDLDEEVLQEDADVKIVSFYEPLGVVAGISPWNFPLLSCALKVASSVLTGNTVVFKPAPTTPVTSLMLASYARDIFPAGVVNVITDANDLGARLSSHEDVDGIDFTGSTATGKKVLEAATAGLKRFSLELGGNDAAVVLDDVDVDSVAAKLYESAFLNAGQVCIAVKRVYAHSSVYDQLCAALARLADSAVVGAGNAESTTMGPLQNAAQFAKAQTYLEIAHRDGEVIAGGATLPDPGYFVQPTIVRDIRPDSPLVQEEQFAPILPVMPYDDVDEAVREVNDTRYGLGNSVWSSDPDRAAAIARRLESGTVWVNQHLNFSPKIPTGGAKESGIGCDHGAEGLIEHTQRVVLSIAKR